MNILLLEDDIILSEIITEHLSEEGYIVVSVYDGEEAYDKIVSARYDLLLFDVNVPSINGFELLKLLKEQQINIPTIFITSLNSGNDLKKGFEIGCDDYLKKPFELVELDVRINHLLKVYKLDNNLFKIDETTYIDKSTYELVKDNQKLKISKKELDIIIYLSSHKDRFVSHTELMANVWVDGDVPSDATIRTYIKNIRAYLGKDFIITIKGVGYRINI